MKAVTVAPGTAESVQLEEVPEPDLALGSVLVEALAVGVCAPTPNSRTANTVGSSRPRSADFGP